MNFRFDTMYGVKLQRPEAVVRMDSLIPSIEIRETDLALRPAFRVVKSHPRARRKRYTVERFMQPCAIVVNGVWYVHPLVAAALRKDLQ